MREKNKVIWERERERNNRKRDGHKIIKDIISFLP